MIELQNISKAYGDQAVLKDLNMTFKSGEISMLLGPSGSGKSTILKLINRLIEPDKGQISIHGELIITMRPEILRRQIGYAIQGVGLFPHMTVRENIAVVPKLLKWDVKRINQRIDALMDIMGIPLSYGDKKPSMLSGGEAQRIGVARALGADPDILLMDEPFGALDPITRRRLQQEFTALQKKLNKTVVFVTHDISEAVRMADYLYLINEGQILTSGRPETMAGQEEAVTKAFFGEQFTLEVLDKYTLNQYVGGINQAKVIDKGEALPSVLLHSDESFRHAINVMLEKGVAEVGVQVGEDVYPLSFKDLTEWFGGVRD